MPHYVVTWRIDIFDAKNTNVFKRNNQYHGNEFNRHVVADILELIDALEAE